VAHCLGYHYRGQAGEDEIDPDYHAQGPENGKGHGPPDEESEEKGDDPAYQHPSPRRSGTHAERLNDLEDAFNDEEGYQYQGKGDHAPHRVGKQQNSEYPVENAYQQIERESSRFIPPEWPHPR